MAFDFPNSPSVGQRVTGVGGIVYVWDGVKWASNIGSVTAQSMGDVGRNLLHNPLFNVAQRGAGPFTVSGYGADRWSLPFAAPDVSSQTLVAATDTHRAVVGDEAMTTYASCAVTGSATAGAFTLLNQPIENVRRLGGRTVTFSFWAACNLAGNKVGVAFDQSFGTGGSPSARANGNGQAIALTTGFARYSLTVTLPSTSGMTLGTAGNDYTAVSIWLSSSSTYAARSGNIGAQSAQFYFWGMQLEIGSVATPLEKPDPRYDLANCQRFYQVGQIAFAGFATAAGSGYASGYPPVVMRAAPTQTISANNCANFSSLSWASSAMLFTLTGATAASGPYSVNANFTASADL